MSKAEDEMEDGKSESNEEHALLRGEVLLGGFIKKALQAKSQGQSNDYDTLIQKLAKSSDEPSYMRKYLFCLKNSISSLTKEYDTLVGTVLSLSWSDKDEEMVEEFVEFLTNLVSSQTYYLHACLKMLVRHFLPFVPKGSTLQDIDLTEQRKKFENTHYALQAVLEIVPTAPAYLMPVVKRNFPYMKKSVEYLECYIKNLLQLSEYAPSLHQDILEVICINVLKIDVEVPKHELEDVQEETTQFDVDLEQEMNGDNNDETVNEVLQEDNVQEADENSNEQTMENEMADKLDILMEIIFVYIEKVCYHDGVYIMDDASDLFEKLLAIFQKVIFPTHDSCHIQFLMFYLCSMTPIFVNTFLELCWTKFQDPNTPTILRQTATAYISSIVARAKYIALSVVSTSLELLVNWIHSYIDDFDSTCGKADVNKHGHFYSLCQAAFYIFIFRHSELLDEEDGLNFVRRLNFERIVTCRLNPLKVCLPAVVNMFATVTRINEIVFCYTIIEKNNRSRLPVASSTFSTSVAKHSLFNQLDSFFPFDPYLLKRSRKFINVIYKEWESIDSDTEKDNSEEEDNNDCLELGKTPESNLPMASLDSFGEMSISPGFSKV